MLLMVEKSIRDKTSHAIYQYFKANNKYMKDCYKNKESSFVKYWEVNNLYGWAICQKLPVNFFGWFEDTSLFREDFLYQTRMIKKNMLFREEISRKH